MLILLFLLLEIVFRFIIPASELPRVAFDPLYKIYNYDRAGLAGTHTIGTWGRFPAKWRVNNKGWINSDDYFTEKKKRRLAVIGDSFVAAFEVDTEKAFHQLLAEHLKDSLEVYSFGFAGAPFSQYLKMAAYAEAQYQPDIFVINLVFNDFSESITHLTSYKNHFWTAALTADSSFNLLEPSQPQLKFVALKKVMLRSAFFRYLIYNLKIHKWRKRKVHLTKENYQKFDVSLYLMPDKNKALKNRLIQYMLGQFKESFPDKRLIFVLDGPRRAIYNDWHENANLKWLPDSIGQNCKRLGFEFINLTPYFVADFQKNGKKFEFPKDNHWNAYGHQLVGKVLYDHLKQHPIHKPSTTNNRAINGKKNEEVKKTGDK